MAGFPTKYCYSMTPTSGLCSNLHTIAHTYNEWYFVMTILDEINICSHTRRRNEVIAITILIWIDILDYPTIVNINAENALDELASYYVHRVSVSWCYMKILQISSTGTKISRWAYVYPIICDVPVMGGSICDIDYPEYIEVCVIFPSWFETDWRNKCFKYRNIASVSCMLWFNSVSPAFVTAGYHNIESLHTFKSNIHCIVFNRANTAFIVRVYHNVCRSCTSTRMSIYVNHRCDNNLNSIRTTILLRHIFQINWLNNWQSYSLWFAHSEYKWLKFIDFCHLHNMCSYCLHFYRRYAGCGSSKWIPLFLISTFICYQYLHAKSLLYQRINETINESICNIFDAQIWRQMYCLCMVFLIYLCLALWTTIIVIVTLN